MESKDQTIPLNSEAIKAFSQSGDETLITGPKIFRDYNLPETVQAAIEKMGWKVPTPIQIAALPYTLKGQDLAGFAQTGTGKTGAFLITIAAKLLAPRQEKMEKSSIGEEDIPDEDQSENLTADIADSEGLSENKKRDRKSTKGFKQGSQQKRKGRIALPKAVVIAPTRELAIQISEEAAQLFDNTGLKTFSVYGGSDLGSQIENLFSENPDLVVATTGRLLDLVKRNVIAFDECQVFVCDEVDRMFEMGFIDDTIFCLDRLSEGAQRLIFSATASSHVKELAFEYLENPQYVELNQEELTPENIDQKAIICDSTNKLKVMMGLLRDLNPSRALIFTNTKITAEWLNFKLQGNGFKTEVITGNLPQNQRIRLIQKIKEGKVQYLIATDIASRGLHIADVSHVFNFDVPDEAANYIHRIGRTARAGNKGQAYTLICDFYGENFMAIAEKLGKAAPKAQWFDQKYLEIEDIAPNPLKTQAVARDRGRERDTGPSGSSRRSGARSRDDRHDARGNREAYRDKDKGPAGRRSGSEQKGRKGRPHAANAQEAHDNRSSPRSRQRQHGHGNEFKSQQVDTLRRDRSFGKQTVAAPVINASKAGLEKNQTSFSFIKKIFSVFFKKKER